MRSWILILFLPCLLWAQEEPEPTPQELPDVPPGEVFVVSDPDLRGASGETDPGAVRAAVDRLVMAATHRSAAADAWRALVKPGDRVGLKVSAAGGELFSTHIEIVRAVCAGLQEAGVAAPSIIVWDRDASELKVAGFVDKPGGYRVRAPYPGKGYLPKNLYVSMILGKLIWGDLDFTRRKSMFEMNPLEKVEDNLSSNSHFAQILNDVDRIINLPVMSAHASCGVAGALYNMTIPNIDNWRRFTNGSGEADPAIPEIYSDPLIAEKVVLHIMDGINAQFAGGPEAQPNYGVAHHAIYASTDPVALDTVALDRIDRWRSRARMKPADDDAKYLQTAREYGLGNASGHNPRLLP